MNFCLLKDHYKYSEIDYVYNKISDSSYQSKKEWSYRRILLGNLYIYLCYVESQLHELTILSNLLVIYGHKNQRLYSDRQYKFYSCAISIYGFMTTCIDIINTLLRDSSLRVYESITRDVEEKRNRLLAHPDQRKMFKPMRFIKHIVGKRTAGGFGIGEIIFPLISFERNRSYKIKNIKTSPQKDFSVLLKYSNKNINRLRIKWNIS